ncbi:MAG: peptidylprolyl isomerase [Nitrospirota bacterium]
MKSAKWLFTLCLIFLFGQHGMATGSVVVDRVIAIVNDDVITLSDLQKEEALRKKTEGKQDERTILEDMIDRKLQMVAAKKGGMDVTDKEVSDALTDIMKRNSMDAKHFEAALAKEGLTVDLYKEGLKEQMTLSRVFNKFVNAGIAINEAEARDFYKKNAKQYILAEEIRLRQIFLPIPQKATAKKVAAIKEKALELYERAKKGDDFTDLVKEASKGPSAAQEGDLGYMERDQLIKEIQEAVKNLKPGDITKPFLCSGGYTILLCEDVRTPVKPFEKVKDEITKKLYHQKMVSTYRSWLQSLRSSSHIENRL